MAGSFRILPRLRRVCPPVFRAAAALAVHRQWTARTRRGARFAAYPNPSRPPRRPFADQAPCASLAGPGRGHRAPARRDGRSVSARLLMPDHGLSTRCVHAGEAPDPATGAHGTPLYANVTYAFRSYEQLAAMRAGRAPHFTYAPRGNPTVRCLELKMADL